MKIISHRGYWLNPVEKNTEAAFRRSFDLSFGTETDVRDLNGELVISHDMPDANAMTLSAFLDLPQARQLPLALNIKSDGLQAELVKKMVGVADWFVFDMSIPDTRGYLQLNVPVLMRMSEVELNPPWVDKCAGIWLDAFDGLWYDEHFLTELLSRFQRVCIVSSELHKRDPLQLWTLIKKFRSSERLILCTDFPEKAEQFLELK